MQVVRIFNMMEACKDGCTSHDAGAHRAWAAISRQTDTAGVLLAATRTRCGCGNYGDWSASVSGTSGLHPCVWAGCTNCRGSAVGVPVLRADLAAFRKLPAAEQVHMIARAAVLAAGRIGGVVEIDETTIDSTVDARLVA